MVQSINHNLRTASTTPNDAASAWRMAAVGMEPGRAMAAVGMEPGREPGRERRCRELEREWTVQALGV